MKPQYKVYREASIFYFNTFFFFFFFDVPSFQEKINPQARTKKLVNCCLLSFSLKISLKDTLKPCYSQIDVYHKKTYYLGGTKTFWVIQNNALPLQCINKINKRKNAINFSRLYTKIIHDKLVILYKVVDFVFKGGTRDFIVINKQGCVSWSSKKRGHHFIFTKLFPKEAIKFILNNCFSSIANIIMI